VEAVPEAIQEEFADLSNNSLGRFEFRNSNLEEFWIKMQRCYPRLGQCSEYTCSFSSSSEASPRILPSNPKYETGLMSNLTHGVHCLLVHQTLNNWLS